MLRIRRLGDDQKSLQLHARMKLSGWQGVRVRRAKFPGAGSESSEISPVREMVCSPDDRPI